MITPEFTRFFAENAENKRYDYPNLNQNSIVMDIGGYEGKFSKLLYEKYNSLIYCYEPVKHFYDKIGFPKNYNIILKNYGISGKTCNKNIILSNDGSSSNICESGNGVINCKFVSINDELCELFNNHDRIDLIKINIEGDEYDLLEKLLSNNEYVSRIDNIQVQFHSFIDDCEIKRNNLIKKLTKTHERTWNYEFVWENWRIKND